MPLHVKSQDSFKMSFKLMLCSFVPVPSLFKKEINAFDSFGIEWLVETILSVDVSLGNTLMILTECNVLIHWQNINELTKLFCTNRRHCFFSACIGGLQHKFNREKLEFCFE